MCHINFSTQDVKDWFVVWITLLIPGIADRLERRFECEENMAWCGFYKRIVAFRNTIYLSIVLQFLTVAMWWFRSSSWMVLGPLVASSIVIGGMGCFHMNKFICQYILPYINNLL